MDKQSRDSKRWRASWNSERSADSGCEHETSDEECHRFDSPSENSHEAESTSKNLLQSSENQEENEENATAPYKYPCLYCDFKTNRLKDFQNHYLRNHIYRLQAAESQQSSSGAQVFDLKEKPKRFKKDEWGFHQCDLCTFSCFEAAEMLQHFKIYHRNHCCKCDFVSSDSVEMFYHYEGEHPVTTPHAEASRNPPGNLQGATGGSEDAQFMYYCVDCPYETLNADDYKKHFNGTHLSSPNLQSESLPGRPETKSPEIENDELLYCHCSDCDLLFELGEIAEHCDMAHSNDNEDLAADELRNSHENTERETHYCCLCTFGSFDIVELFRHYHLEHPDITTDLTSFVERDGEASLRIFHLYKMKNLNITPDSPPSASEEGPEHTSEEESPSTQEEYLVDSDDTDNKVNASALALALASSPSTFETRSGSFEIENEETNSAKSTDEETVEKCGYEPISKIYQRKAALIVKIIKKRRADCKKTDGIILQKVVDEKNENSKWKCPKCDKTYFDLTHHIRNNKDESHFCERGQYSVSCSKNFLTRTLLRGLIKEKSKKRLKDRHFKCRKCGKQFRTKESLRKHCLIFCHIKYHRCF